MMGVRVTTERVDHRSYLLRTVWLSMTLAIIIVMAAICAIAENI